METTQLSTKGQIVLPKSIRDAHAWRPGAKFTVEETKDGILLRPVPLFPRTTIDQVIGCLKPPKGMKPPTEAQMRAAIARGVRERHASGRY
jgi:AbrB family looped-hinge helix DNA binding protein